VLRGAPERDDGKVLASSVVVDVKLEPDSRLTSDEDLRRRTSRSSGPARTGLKARHPGCPAPPVVDLIRRGTSEPGMRPAGVVPREVKGQILAEDGQTVGDEDQQPSALVLEAPNAPLDYRETSVLPDCPKSVLDPSPVAPSVESSRGEWHSPALVDTI
jgi:hypothetical protein